MRIAIDARMVRVGSMHGIARYAYELLKGLCDFNSPHEYVVLVNRGSPLLLRDWPDHIKLVEVRSRWIGLREHLEIPRVLRRERIDLFHAPSFVAPLWVPCQMIMTIHDLNHLVLPHFYTPMHQLYYRILVQACIRKSKLILTVSEFSKTEIVKHLTVPEPKVFVTYNGVSRAYRPVQDVEFLEYVRELYELPEKFIFCLTNKKPHKNVMKLVQAYCHADLKMPLVLACPVDLRVIRLAESYGKKHRIYFAKFIQEEHLPAIYSMTHLFVYPSTYEGFGLPPLEALACGAPVVVSESSSLPEVVGKHAIFMNPYDHDDMARALEVGVKDQSLRAQITQNYESHVERFSWTQLVQHTVALYEHGQCDQDLHLVKAGGR